MMVPDAKRDREICNAFKSGKSTVEIGKHLGVSRQRVHQILQRNNVKSHEGGKKLKLRLIREAKKAAKDKDYINRYGCDCETYREIRKHKCEAGLTPQEAFKQQRKNSKQRGIEWNFKFYDWWSVWEASGKWEKRGRNLGEYVMGRKNDNGAYEIGNVQIITCSENIVLANTSFHKLEKVKSG